MSEPLNEKQRTSHDLRAHLNRSGYGFHYAVVRRFGELSIQKKPDWVWGPPTSEFPVVVGPDTVHIDFVVSGHSKWSRPTPVYLVGECKRVDRKFSRWGFVCAPFAEEEIVFDRFIFRPPSDLRTEPVVNYSGSRPYHLGLPIKGEAPGDSGPSGSGAINEATAQVLRGGGGFINHIFGPRDGEGLMHFAFLPVIFTTAELWVTEVDISSAELTTGDVQNLESEKKDWIWFNHNRCPRLRHGLKSAESKTENL